MLKCVLTRTVGACVSPDPEDNRDAQMWFNCVEEMVFTDDDFGSDIEPPTLSDIAIPVNTPDNRLKLQALQAAYHVCLYQNWEGTDPSKRRIRRHRFSTVVSVRAPQNMSFKKFYSTVSRPRETLESTQPDTWPIAHSPNTNSAGMNL